MQQLTAQQAYENGRLLRAQFKNLTARQYLKYAADLGEPNAAYLYAMEVANYRTTIRTPPESQHYLLMAAQGGNRQAMRELYRNGEWLRSAERVLWQQHYYDAVIELGARNPSQTAYELALYFQENDPKLAQHYLGIAVEFEYPAALMLMAQQIEQGQGSYPMPGSRVTEARKTYLQAAKTGYIPAVRKYIQLLENKGKYKDAYYWRQQAVQHGDLTALAAMGSILSGQSDVYHFVEPDLKQAKAYLGLYLEVSGSDRLSNIYQNSQRQLLDISMQLNEHDKEIASEIEMQLEQYQPFFNHDAYWDN
ncbi:sel1 repeat family protein [Vibrio mimicus]